MDFSKNFKAIMQDSLSDESIYKRFKDTLSAYYDKQTISDEQKAQLFTKAMAEFAQSITTSAMSAALELSFKEEELKKLDKELELLDLEKQKGEIQNQNLEKDGNLIEAKIQTAEKENELLTKKLLKEDDRLSKELSLIDKDISQKEALIASEVQRKALLEQQTRGFLDNRVIKSAQLTSEEVSMIMQGGNNVPTELWTKMMENINLLNTLASKHPELSQ